MSKNQTVSSRSLVVGASGMVGAEFLNTLGREKVLATSRAKGEGWLTMDLANVVEGFQVLAALDSFDLDAIYCVGGMTYVDGCETEPELAWRINARGPGVLAAYSHRRGLPFVYFSTEYVFDGSDRNPGPYTEGSTPSPISVYGKTKLEGERLVLAAHPQALIVRTTVVYGPDPGGKNYVYSLLRALSSGLEMAVPEDQISTPTYSRDLANATIGLVNARASGIFHVCGPERLGRLEFARIVAAKFDLDPRLLKGVSTATLSQKAPRPLSAGLAIDKLNRLFPTFRMRTVAESLVDCASEIRTAVVP